MKLDDFLEELILEQYGWSHERFLQEKDIPRQLVNKYKALIDRLNLLFDNLPDTYSSDAINIEGTDMFQLHDTSQSVKAYTAESQAVEDIFLRIVFLYITINQTGNKEFLKKIYFKVEKLFLKIGRQLYTSDSWRNKAILK